MLLLGATRLMAVPAYPEAVQFQQPNSRIFLNIRIQGDEKVHWAETEDGYTLLHNDKGALVYAVADGQGGMTTSTLIATAPSDRPDSVARFLKSVPKHLRFSQEQVKQYLVLWDSFNGGEGQAKEMSNVIGHKKFLLIMFQFQDKSFHYSKMAFKMMANQLNYTNNGAFGSVRDYYLAASQGLFDIEFDIVGPYTGIHSAAHYGNTYSGYQDFANEAVQYASADVDFSDYDNDHDGYIDGLHIIFAGNGEEATGNADEIWSHKSIIGSSPVYNNTVVNVYSCSPELNGNTSSMCHIGVMCHELGHVLGAPDYYDTDYSSHGQYPGLGMWDIMSSGSYNMGGTRPAQHNPYTRIYIYHWATCDTLTQPQLVTMRPSNVANTDIHRINTSTPGDFFLLENRQQSGWDNGIPGHGMLVYHIHPDAHGSSVTNYTHPMQMYILTNDAAPYPTSDPYSYGTVDAPDTPLPGTNSRTELTDYTTPQLRPWNQTPNNTPITYISENTNTKTVSFCFKEIQPSVSNLAATPVSDTSVRLDWDNYGSLASLVLQLPEGGTGADVAPSGIHTAGDTLADGSVVVYRGTSGRCVVPALSPDHNYTFRVYVWLRDSLYSDSYREVSTHTLSCGPQAWSMEDFESAAVGTLPTCWMGDWAVAPDHSVRPAAGSVSRLQCPPVAFPAGTSHAVLSFRLRFPNSLSDSNRLCIYYRPDVNSDLSIVKTIRPSECATDWFQVYVSLAGASSNAVVAFEFVRADTDADIAIDDITVVAGYLIHAYTEGGGSIQPSGYFVAQEDESLLFTLQRDPGYMFQDLYVNGYKRTSSIDTTGTLPTFRITANKELSLRAVYVRNTDIDNAETGSVRVYPNPTENSVTVEGITPDAGEVMLYNVLGQCVLQQPSASRVCIDLTTYPRGIYMLRIGTQSTKIIKK